MYQNQKVMIQQVHRDTVRTLRKRISLNDTMAVTKDSLETKADDLVIAQDSIVLEPVAEVVLPKPVLTAFDSITPCNLSQVTPVVYFRPKEIPAKRDYSNTDLPMDYDLLAATMVFCFTIYLCVKYAINCPAAWRALAKDLQDVA